MVINEFTVNAKEADWQPIKEQGQSGLSPWHCLVSLMTKNNVKNSLSIMMMKELRDDDEFWPGELDGHPGGPSSQFSVSCSAAQHHHHHHVRHHHRCVLCCGCLHYDHHHVSPWRAWWFLRVVLLLSFFHLNICLLFHIRFTYHMYKRILFILYFR